MEKKNTIVAFISTVNITIIIAVNKRKTEKAVRQDRQKKDN